MRRPTLSLFLLILCLHPLVLAAQTSGRSSAPPGAPARRTAAAVMSPALVKELVELGKHRAEFPDIVRRSMGAGVMMLVVSNRQLIARASAKAEQTGASYSPPPELRKDEITITCGDTNSRRHLDCDLIVVANLSDKTVPALTSQGGPGTFHNDIGATWIVRTATATYPATALKDGFVVTGWSRDKQSWTLFVTAQDAVEGLLLGPSPGSALAQ